MAVYSAIKRHSVLPGLVILGDLSIQGNIKSVKSLSEPLQVGMDNGARRALDPAGEQAELPRSLRGHRGAGRSDLLLRPDDGGDEGSGDDVNTVPLERTLWDQARFPVETPGARGAAESHDSYLQIVPVRYHRNPPSIQNSTKPDITITRMATGTYDLMELPPSIDRRRPCPRAVIGYGGRFQDE